MDEIEFAEQVLLVAEHLRILPGNKEVINRFIVSKLYYFLFQLFLLIQPPTPPLIRGTFLS
jgi:hypothetical protein